MTSVFCMIAFPQTLYADEYALKGTISSALELMEGTTSWNTSNNTGKINIKLHSDANGAIFTAYKLLNIANDGSGRLTVSIPTDAQAFWNEYTAKTSATVGDIKDKINSKTEAAEKSSSIVNKFVEFTGTRPTGTPSAPAADGKTQITTEFGFYAILQTGAPDDGHIASAPVLACLPMQDPDNNTTWLSEFTIVPKDDTISVTKKVHASDESDFKDETITNIGDTVTYEIIAELPEYGADIINSGVAGDTIAEMGARLSYDVYPYHPDIIIMQGGANDFLMSLYPGAKPLAERLIRLALRIRKQLPDTKIYIESMYPAYTKRIGLMPSWAEGKSNEEIQKINTWIKKLCKENDFNYIDVFSHLIGADGQLSREYTVDGIHLQDSAYEIVAEILICGGVYGK